MADLSGTSSLRVGERLIVLSDDGLLAAEYALFDSTEIVLHASDPVTVREAGYMTTAAEALRRLALAGVTPDLASEAARAVRPEVIVSFARGATSRSVAAELGAQELFDGAIYRASPDVQCYEGAWLDLRSLAPQVELPSAALLLQVLHLAATLGEVPGQTTLHLSTSAAMRERRPSERTYQRPALDAVRRLPEALRRLRPRTLQIDIDLGREARLHSALLARVRERLSKDTPPGLRAHLAVLDGTLSALSRSVDAVAEPMGDEEVLAIERQLDERDTRDAAEQIQRLEDVRGNVAAVRYLRARLALLAGEEPPRSVAQQLSGIANEDAGFHQAALGAARTWLAAGETGHARYFAHKLLDNTAARDSERLVALEILATVPTTSTTIAPPLSATAQVAESSPRLSRVTRLLGLGDRSPAGNASTPAATPPAPSPAAAPPAATPPAAMPPGAPYISELVESLALPIGASESGLGVNDRPLTPMQARIAMTRLARDLARDYRLWYGRTLRCDVIAIDGIQQHLSHRFAGASLADESVAWELQRHGALVSEILARKFGGAWVDVGPSEPGYWAMLVPPGRRTHPIGRVYRFVALGHRERDLVSYFIDLEERARRS
jgi:hypothetical protein